MIRLRPFFLLAFIVGLAGMFILPFEIDLAWIIGSAVAFSALWAFVLTEGFGSFERKRTKIERWSARIFLVPLTIVSLGSVAFAAIEVFHAATT